MYSKYTLLLGYMLAKKSETIFLKKNPFMTFKVVFIYYLLSRP